MRFFFFTTCVDVESGAGKKVKTVLYSVGTVCCLEHDSRRGKRRKQSRKNQKSKTGFRGG
jgi:hypothetical protein